MNSNSSASELSGLTVPRNRAKRMAFSLLRLLHARTILVMATLIGLSIALTLWNVSHLSETLVEEQARQEAKLYAHTLQQSRTAYSSEVVSQAQDVEGIETTHDYAGKTGAIPLPATFLIELSHRIGMEDEGFQVRLYSDYPFPWRKEEGGAKDDFERDALVFLRKNPDLTFARIEKTDGRRFFRYAQADVLRPSCVGCHNSYPGTPKADWKVGDVRGILTVSRSLDIVSRRVSRGLQHTFLILGGSGILLLAALFLVTSKLRNTSRELELRVMERTEALQHTNQQLTREQEKSDRLLLNILPEPIAEQLKEKPGSIASGFANVSILFADIVGFTQLSSRVSPIELVNVLNEIFCEFDRLAERYRLEKIKTIGDAYMVVGGLPSPASDRAEAVANMALDMQRAVADFSKKRDKPLQIRVGINIGPVVAGVIGQKKFAYDLWGDAVNVASRMESTGLPGKIQVTEEVYLRLKEQYLFDERGKVEVKGKGELVSYWLIGKQYFTKPTFEL